MKKIKKISENKNFTAINVGNLNEIGEHGFKHPLSGETIKGKLFVKDALKATSTEISYNILPPKVELPYLHNHKKNEETYIFLKGKGRFQVDGEYFDVEEGSLVRIAPAGVRGMKNTGDEGLIYLVIQAKENSLEEFTFGDGAIIKEAVKWDK